MPELEEPQRELAIGALPRAVDEVVHRAVHRLEAVVLTVDVERREHALAVVRQVPGGVEERLVVDVPLADVVLHLALDDAALGVEHRQAGPDLVGEGEQVELAAELAVVAALGLLDAVEVSVELLLRLPGGAVDALELLVL